MISEEEKQDLPPSTLSDADEMSVDEVAVDDVAGEEAVATQEDAEPYGPGKLLCRKREALGMSVQQVADELHITMHYVRALESNSHDKLPGDVFVRGYIRAYANLLKLDPVVLINVYNDYTNQQASAEQEANNSRARRRRDRNLPWIIFSGIAFVGIAIALWYFNARSPASTSAPMQGAAPSDASGPANVAPTQIVPAPALNNNAPATIDNVATTLATDIVTANAAVPGDTDATVETAPGATVPEPVAGAPTTVTDVTTAVTTGASTVNASTSASVVESAGSAAGQSTLTDSVQPLVESTPAPQQPTLQQPTLQQPTLQQEVSPETNVNPGSPEISVPASAQPVDVQPLPRDPAPAEEPTTPEQLPASDTTPVIAASQEPVQADGQIGSEERVISVDAGGEDLVQITFNGESMVQVEDGNDKQIYRDIRTAGDVLRITGSAPFNILLGDAASTELMLNGNNIDFTSNIRIDNSVRLTIGL